MISTKIILEIYLKSGYFTIEIKLSTKESQIINDESLEVLRIPAIYFTKKYDTKIN